MRIRLEFNRFQLFCVLCFLNAIAQLRLTTLVSTKQSAILKKSPPTNTIAAARSEVWRNAPHMAACLMIKDDNHWLIEWLAYHYHMLPLRSLVVFPDPSSRTSPMPILERWTDRMQISVWNETSFEIPKDHLDDIHKMKQDVPIALHRAKQRYFYQGCLKHFRLIAGRSMFTDLWVTAIDTDEFVRPTSTTLYDSPGIVLGELQKRNQSTHTSSTGSCLSVARRQYGFRENTTHESPEVGVPQVLSAAGILGQDMLTMRWKMREDHALELVKNIVNVVQVPASAWYNSRSLSVHKVLDGSACPPKEVSNETLSELVIHHYLGTKEQFRFRADFRMNTRRRPLYWAVGRNAKTWDASILSWLNGFVSIVGGDTAVSLLQGVGRI